MNAAELRQKSDEELQKELLNLLREQFSMRLARSTGAFKNNARFKQVRKDVARIKTLMGERKRANG
ncbi:50S ribosomal protein L29 [Thiorhodospira sibirica]|uniref:50S ribosomal protein L29 n=1 Tax=Thiorhodospira sibirica TaxID=154347 RepID=UPI00022C3A23|nr:50S ribosomal protein L29 [Thiorhodospira sibirica]